MATPKKALAYVTNILKASKTKSLNLDPNRDFNEQMRETAKLWNKAQTHDSRKYIHLKLSFHPDDSKLNKLTEDGAMDIGTTIVKEFFPSFESVLSVHVDKEHLHVHAIINAVDPLTGKMLNMRSAQYRALKDRVQEICSQKGLSSLDWRAATKAKREKECTDGSVVRETFTEQRMRQEGKTSIKSKLRSIINEAIMTATSFDEFQENLKQKDVILTRATSNTISYKLSEFRPYRGDTLGQDFTMYAIRTRISYNERKTGFDAKIKSAELRANGKRMLSAEESDAMYAFGRTIGLGREEIGQFMDHALYASKKQKQTAWYVYKNATTLFWDNYRASQQEISNRLDELYRIRRRLKEAEYILNNSKTSMWGILYAFTLRLSSGSGLAQIEEEIRRYHDIRKKLHQDIAYFKTVSAKGIDAIKGSSFSTAEYMKVLAEMHDQADQALFDLLDIPPQHQYVLTSDYRMITKREYLQEKQQLLESERSLEYEL